MKLRRLIQKLPVEERPHRRGDRIDRNFCCTAYVALCAGFSDAGMTMLPCAVATGVREAPRHEIAGSGAPTVPRALWGFGRGVGLEEVGPKRSR